MNAEIDPKGEIARRYGIHRVEIPNGFSYWHTFAEIPEELGQVAVVSRYISEEEVFEEVNELLDQDMSLLTPKHQQSELLRYPTVETQMKKLQEFNGAYPVIPVVIAPNLVAIVEAKGLYVPGYTWTHENSKASYYLIGKYKSPGVRAYHLNPEELTSGHAHFVRSEQIKILWGEGEINIDGSVSKLDGEVTIPPGIPHKIKAGQRGALIAVVTYGSGNCLSMDDHHPAPSLTFTPQTLS